MIYLSAEDVARELGVEAAVVTICLVARVHRLRVEEHGSFRAFVNEHQADAWLAIRRLSQRGIHPQDPLGRYEARGVSRSA